MLGPGLVMAGQLFKKKIYFVGNLLFGQTFKKLHLE